MKNFILICTFLTFILPVSAQDEDEEVSTEFPGWFMFEWDLDSATIFNVINRNPKLFMTGNDDDPKFVCEDMNTWLKFKNKKLNEVQQRKTFSVNQTTEAQKFYDQKYKEIVLINGKPTETKKDAAKKTIHHTWKLEYSIITMEYDYLYKVVDELGAGSYWVEIVYQPVKK